MRERHQVVIESQMDGVGVWSLRTESLRMAYERGSGYPSYAVLLWGPRDEEGISEVCKSSPIETSCKTKPLNASSLVIDTLYNSIDEENLAIACVLRRPCLWNAGSGWCVSGALEATCRESRADPRNNKGGHWASEESSCYLADSPAPWNPREAHQVALAFATRVCLYWRFRWVSQKTSTWTLGACTVQYVIVECSNIRIFITERPHLRGVIGKYFPGHPDLLLIEPTEDIRWRKYQQNKTMRYWERNPRRPRTFALI